ncbi:MAG: glycosyltransferase family 4 protein [Eubacterium sp.]|nr:glycosyltransferase family 4 protein [Eubacterium sp.]
MLGHKRIPSREGGIEIVVGELSRRMVKLGNSVTAYNRKSRHIAGRDFTESKRPKEYEGVSLKWIYTPNSARLNAVVYSFFAVLRAIFGGFDVIHFHAEGPASMVPLARLFGKRCVVTIHGLDWQRAKWGGFATKYLLFGEKCAAKYANEIIVLSKSVQDYFKEKYCRDTVYIPNGINMPEQRDAEIIKDKYSLEKDSYLLFLGRLVPEKGVHYLINAYKQLKTDKKLVIAGGASHTVEYEKELKELAGDNENIIFTGFVQGNELDELYSNAYLYVLPSDLEGMPISLLEAMSYGNCCLTSDIDECTEVCGNNAVYFSKGSESSLWDRLDELLNSPETVSELKAASAEYVLSRYNWDSITKKTLDLYKGQITDEDING